MISAIASARSGIRGLSEGQSTFASHQDGKAKLVNASRVSGRKGDSLKCFVQALLRSLAVGAA